MVLADVRTTVATHRYDPFSLWGMKSAGDGFTLLGRVVGRRVALCFLNRSRCSQAPLAQGVSRAGARGDPRGLAQGDLRDSRPGDSHGLDLLRQPMRGADDVQRRDADRRRRRPHDRRLQRHSDRLVPRGVHRRPHALHRLLRANGHQRAGRGGRVECATR